MDKMRASRWRHWLQNAVFVLFLAAAIGLLAFLSERYHFQLDWTIGQRNTLSDASRALVERMQGPVAITVYAP